VHAKVEGGGWIADHSYQLLPVSVWSKHDMMKGAFKQSQANGLGWKEYSNPLCLWWFEITLTMLLSRKVAAYSQPCSEEYWPSHLHVYYARR
jgi:hypothetical protein